MASGSGICAFKLPSHQAMGVSPTSPNTESPTSDQSGVRNRRNAHFFARMPAGDD